MDEKNASERDRRTAWHPLLVFTMERFAPPDRKVIGEYSLNSLPQRIDIVVVEHENVPTAQARKLRSIFDYTGKRTLIEYKGVTDDLEPTDVFAMLAYACQYMILESVSDLGEMCLMFVADHFPAPFVQRIKDMKGSFVPIGNGLWRGELAGLRLHGVELRNAYKAGPSERLLYLFTRPALKDPQALARRNELDEEDLLTYDLLHQYVQRFRRDPMTMNMKDLDLADKRLEEAIKTVVSHASVEVRLDGLTPEQRLAGLAPEQRLAGLAPEQLLAGMTPEQLQELTNVARKLNKLKS